MLPSRRELDFYKIAFFKLDGKRLQKIIRKSMDFEVETRDKSMNKCFEKISFFLHRFFIDFSAILGGLGAPSGSQDGPKVGELGLTKAT